MIKNHYIRVHWYYGARQLTNEYSLVISQEDDNAGDFF